MPDEKLSFVPGGATQDPFKILDRPFYAAPGFLDGAEKSALWGRAAPMGDEVEIVSVREITAEELAALPTTVDGQSNVGFKAVERLRPRHHEIARLMAAGLKDGEIGELLSVSLQHLHRLRRSPAFQHLLAYYMASRDAETLDLRARIEHAASLGLERVQERLEDDEHQIPIGALRDIAFGLLDRAGFNPTTKVASVAATLSAADLRQLKEVRDAAIRAATGVQILEASPSGGESEPGNPPGRPTDLGSRLSLEGPEGQGPSVGTKIPQASDRLPRQLDLFGTDPPQGSVVPLSRDWR